MLSFAIQVRPRLTSTALTKKTTKTITQNVKKSVGDAEYPDSEIPLKEITKYINI